MARVSIPVEHMSGAVKSGDIYFRNKTHVIKKFKKHYVILYATSSNGVARLELYDSKKSLEGGASYSFLIPGSEVVAVKEAYRPMSHSSEEQQFGFTISTKESLHQFYTTDREDLRDWLQMLGKTLISQTNSQQQKTTVTLENDVYESADTFLMEFPVTVGISVRQKLGVDGEVRLRVESGFITLISLERNRFARWAIEHLRRFGYTDNEFHLEAGRKSDHGEGTFHFITTQGKQIHTLVHKQKNYVRDKVTKSLPPGLMSSNSDECEIPLTTGGHVYEEIPVHLKNSSISKSPPEKPARLQQQSRARQTSSGGATPPRVPTAGKPFEERTELEALPKVKSQSTKNYPKVNRSANHEKSPYCETYLRKEAWKSHGIDVEPPYENLNYEERNYYDSLEFFKHKETVYEEVFFPPDSQGNGTAKEKDPSNSEIGKNDKPGQRRGESVAVVKPSEPIYATVLKHKKTKKPAAEVDVIVNVDSQRCNPTSSERNEVTDIKPK